ncbi:MAG: hypothetical protein ACFE8J_09375 [Candidatus Heimdallarchaeota archaeon]
MNNLSVKRITVIQLAIATLVSLLFQFVVPFSWQPLHLYNNGINAQHGDPGLNLVIFTISQWYFSLSVVWFFNRDNKYLNNFLAYSIAPLSTILIPEFFIYDLYYDYIHIFPVIVGLYITWKKRETLVEKYVIPNFIFVSIWLFTVYFFKLAYYQGPFLTFLINWFVISVLNFFFSLFIRFFKGRTDNKL